jgi:hypothetical protein
MRDTFQQLFSYAQLLLLQKTFYINVIHFNFYRSMFIGLRLLPQHFILLLFVLLIFCFVYFCAFLLYVYCPLLFVLVCCAVSGIGHWAVDSAR